MNNEKDDRVIYLIKKSVVDNAKDEDILEEVDALINHDGETLPLLDYKASVLFKSERYSDCIEVCDKILASDKNNIAALEKKANAFFMLKDTKKARNICSLILKLDYSNIAAKDLIESVEMIEKVSQMEENCKQADRDWKLTAILGVVFVILYGIFIYTRNLN